MASDRWVQLHATNHSTMLSSEDTMLAEMRINWSGQNVTSSNNILAYQPRYLDEHNSNLAALFINLDRVFPCLVPLTAYYPICTIFSNEEDGFRGGKVVIGASDSGNSFRVFSTSGNIKSYAIAIQGCQQLTPSCFPTNHQMSVACLLPRAACSE